MPITEFQRAILLLLAANRNPNSYAAGGTVIQRVPNSKRYSKDIDFFHDVGESVQLSSQADIATLSENGYHVEIVLNQPNFVRVIASKDGDAVKLDWVQDTAFRFFPVIPDKKFGYRLHDIDLAVNKCLALANRNEVRDIVDILQLNQTTLSFSAACWGACGKDPGFSPPLLLDCIRRHSIIRSEQIQSEALHVEISAVALKQEWLSVLDIAEQELRQYPAEELGCIYVDRSGEALRAPLSVSPAERFCHYGSVNGSQPNIVQSR